jgi:hypothetical protein
MFMLCYFCVIALYGELRVLLREVKDHDTGWPSDTTTSCASTLKLDIIEAWKRRKKKNHRKEAWKRRKKRRQLKMDRLKQALTPAIAGLLESAMSWP